MASITTLANGRRRLQFVGADGARKSPAPEGFGARRGEDRGEHRGAPVGQTAERDAGKKVRKRLAGLDAETYNKLVAAGHVKARESLKAAGA